MTALQTFEFSQSWPRPFTRIRNLRRRMAELKLRAIDKKEQLPHRKAIIEVMIKACRDAKRAGWRIVEWRIEYSLGDGTKLKVDLYLVLEKDGHERVRMFEVQLTWQQSWKYRVKMEKAKRFRKRKGITPFLFTFLIEDRDATESHKFGEVNKAFKIGQAVMEDSPNLSLFLFHYLPQWRSEYNVVTDDCYLAVSQKRSPLVW